MADFISIEVAFALPQLQKIVSLDVEAGTVAVDAAKQSGIERFFDTVTFDFDTLKMGIFGKAIKPKTHVLQAGDRIEIYRPLISDPKATRKARAEKAKAKPKAD